MTSDAGSSACTACTKEAAGRLVRSLEDLLLPPLFLSGASSRGSATEYSSGPERCRRVWMEVSAPTVGCRAAPLFRAAASSASPTGRSSRFISWVEGGGERGEGRKERGWCQWAEQVDGFRAASVSHQGNRELRVPPKHDITTLSYEIMSCSARYLVSRPREPAAAAASVSCWGCLQSSKRLRRPFPRFIPA